MEHPLQKGTGRGEMLIFDYLLMAMAVALFEHSFSTASLLDEHESSPMLQI